MKEKPTPQLMSIDQLADYLGLSKQTLYNWLSKKKIPGIKIGKVWRFKRAEIENWLKKFGRNK
jgi:excisionase family DNA binding protein